MAVAGPTLAHRPPGHRPARAAGVALLAALVALVALVSGCADPGVTADQRPRLSLTVAAAAVDEPVSPGGLSAEGTISPARGELLWYTGHGRVAPGEIGTAVVAGHVSYEGEPDVFAGLALVGVGDEVRLRDGDLETVWTVTEVDVVAKADLRLDDRVWGEQQVTRRLVLVTCDDELGFRPDGHRTANLLVVAEPVGT